MLRFLHRGLLGIARNVCVVCVVCTPYIPYTTLDREACRRRWQRRTAYFKMSCAVALFKRLRDSVACIHVDGNSRCRGGMYVCHSSLLSSCILRVFTRRRRRLPTTVSGSVQWRKSVRKGRSHVPSPVCSANARLA